MQEIVKKESLKTLKIDLNNVYFAHFITGDSTFKGPCSADDNVSCLTADTGAESSTSAWFHIFVEI